MQPTIDEALLPFLARIGRSAEDITYLLSTHCDFDHIGGNRRLSELAPRARLLCHELDRAMTEDVEVLIADRYGEFREAHGYDDTDDATKVHIRSVTGTHPVDIGLSGGERVRLGQGWTVSILHTPGHSPGSVSVWDPRSSVAIIGDAVLGAGLLTSDGSPAFPPTYRQTVAYRASISALFELHPSILATSHYPLYRGGEVADFLSLSSNFADRVQRAVLEALDASPDGLTSLQIIDAVWRDLGSWPEATAGALMYPVVGHLEELASLRRVSCDAGACPSSGGLAKRGQFGLCATATRPPGLSRPRLRAVAGTSSISLVGG